jgi:hypothetical protein
MMTPRTPNNINSIEGRRDSRLERILGSFMSVAFFLVFLHHQNVVKEDQKERYTHEASQNPLKPRVSSSFN